MLSLPLIAPQNEYTLFLTPHLRPAQHHPYHLSNDPSSHAHHQQQQQQQRRANASSSSSAHNTSLTHLSADEAAIAHRKHNIRHFGAGWIKPPGVTRTLQAELEERAEREEQAAIERREQMLADMQAMQEAEEARARAAEGAADDEAEEGERDLDDEIPDADEGEEEAFYDDDEDEDEDDDEEERTSIDMSGTNYGNDDGDDAAPLHHLPPTQNPLFSPPRLASPMGMDGQDLTFNDDSLLEGSFLPSDTERDRILQARYARLEEAELTGVARDEEDLGVEHEDLERDLDDSVPEAGEYQHTDTELEVSSSEEEESDIVGEGDVSGFAGPRGSGGRAAFVSAGLDGRRRSSGGRQAVAFAQNVRGGGTGTQMRLEGSERSLRSRDLSSLLESSFVDSSPVVGRLRSGNFRGHGGHR